MGILRLPNFYAVVALLAVGGLIVTGIFRVGANYNEGKHVQATAETNAVIVEDRGKDEAELTAAAETAKHLDGVTRGLLKQQLILTEETAVLLGGVR